MLTTILALLTTAVLAGSPPVPSPQDVARRDRLRKMLIARDKAPPCTELSKVSDRLVEDLQWLMDNVKAPPWVGVRAAQCSVELHATTEVSRIQGWLLDPEKPGLTLVVLGELDTMPIPVVIAVIQTALTGPHAAKVHPRLMRSANPQIRALLQAQQIKP